ncbi:unnamed protein product [Boreogadus saida]
MASRQQAGRAMRRVNARRRAALQGRPDLLSVPLDGKDPQTVRELQARTGGARSCVVVVPFPVPPAPGDPPRACEVRLRSSVDREHLVGAPGPRRTSAGLKVRYRPVFRRL